MTYILSIFIFILVAAMLGIGVMVAGKRIKGSCGGIAVMGTDGEPLSCSTCPNRDKNPDCERKEVE